MLQHSILEIQASKVGQKKKGQKLFWAALFLNPFSQLPAVKKEWKTVQLVNIEFF